jgi:hypothetical protein
MPPAATTANHFVEIFPASAMVTSWLPELKSDRDLPIATSRRIAQRGIPLDGRAVFFSTPVSTVVSDMVTRDE